MVGESLLIKLAEKVVDKIFEKTAGKPISKFFEDIEKKNAFKKAISESFLTGSGKWFRPHPLSPSPPPPAGFSTLNGEGFTLKDFPRS